MEPIRIICTTCAAKLKATEASSIGQRLGCPKCGTMNLVEAPAGTKLSESGSIVSESFDEIDLDSLLKSDADVGSKPGKRAEKKASPKNIAPPPAQRKRLPAQEPESISRPKPRPPAKKPASDVAPVVTAAKKGNNESDVAIESPMVPDGQWVSPRSKKNRQTLLVVASIIGSVLVLATLVWGLLQLGGGSTPEEVVAKSDDSGQPTVAADVATKPGPTGDVPPAESEIPIKDDSDSTKPETELIPDPAESEIGVPPKVDMPAPEIDIPKPETVMGESETKPDVLPGESDDVTFDSTGDEAAPETGEDLETEEDAFAMTLASTGVSLLDARDAASLAKVRAASGRPKYFVEKRIPARLDIEKQKELDIPGVIYTDVTLQRALHDLSDISGISLSVEAPMFRAASLEINPELSIKVENQNVGEVISRIADHVGASAVASPSGFVLMPLSSDNPIIERIDTSRVDNVARVEAELMLRKLVYPEGWVPSDEPDREGNKIRFVGKTLEVSAPAGIVAECKELVAARFALDTGAARDGQDVFQPFADLSIGKFAQPFESFDSIRVTIGSRLEDFESKYGVTVMADWNRLRPMGWSAQAMAPGSMSEATVGQAISELAQSLDAAVFVLDEKTVWLTTFEAATNYFFVKFYPIADIAGGKLTGKQVVGVVERAIGRELRFKGVALHLVSGEEYLAVRAPQFLHRQIVAVLGSLTRP